MYVRFYIVRDKSGDLKLFNEEPVKREDRWETKYSGEPGRFVWDFDGEFAHLEWKDTEPEQIVLYTLSGAKERVKYDSDMKKYLDKKPKKDVETNLYT